MTYTSLRNNVVRIAFAKSGAFEKIHDISFASTLFVQTIFILFDAHSSTQDYSIVAGWKTLVRVVENDFNCDRLKNAYECLEEGRTICRQGCSGGNAFMQERLSLLVRH